MEVHPPLTDHEMKTYFIGTLGEPFKEKMIGSGVEDFAKLVSIGEWIEREYKKGEYIGGKGNKEETVNFIQRVGGSERMKNKNGKGKGEHNGRPFPDYGISHSELFHQLCDKGLMYPSTKPVKEYTAPFPPWYKADLTCEYHV